MSTKTHDQGGDKIVKFLMNSKRKEVKTTASHLKQNYFLPMAALLFSSFLTFASFSFSFFYMVTRRDKPRVCFRRRFL